MYINVFISNILKALAYFYLNIFEYRLGILFRLFIVMGILWVFEVVTSLVSFESNPFLEVIEAIFDVCNSLQGINILLYNLESLKKYL